MIPVRFFGCQKYFILFLLTLLKYNCHISWFVKGDVRFCFHFSALFLLFFGSKKILQILFALK